MMRKTYTGRLMLMAAMLIGVLMATVTLRALAAELPSPDDKPAPTQNQPDFTNTDMPPLESGGPAGPVVFAQGTGQKVNSTTAQSSADAPLITVWYSQTPTFGVNGDPQKWINILGNVSNGTITSLTYSLNGGPALTLNRGDDKKRLAETGDFNIELDYTDLVAGANQVVIKATDSNAATTELPITVTYTDGGNSWLAQTYTYSWQGLSAISDKAQIVDGQWVIESDTIRPTVLAFDRLVAIGDLSWRDYTVTVPITIHSMDSAGFGGASNGPGIGMMVRWQGHFDAGDGSQPRLGWRRLGAMGWYRWQKDANDNIVSGFQLLGNGGTKLVEDSRPLAFETPYIFKLKVQSNPDPNKTATYSFKVWEASAQEPANYQLVAAGNAGEPQSGSMLLVAHHVDASFGTVTVDLASVASAPTLTTATSGTGTGNVGVVPNKTTFRFGEDATLTASANAGSIFTGWTGNVAAGEITGNVANVSMFGNRKITALFTDPSVVTPISDDFSACELNTSLWTFTNPLGDATQGMTGTQLKIDVPAGASHDFWTTSTDAPRIMQFAEDKDFEIAAKFDSVFSKKTQLQGLLIQQDAANWLRFSIQHEGTSYRIIAATYVGGQLKTRADVKNLSLTPPVYLRINRSDDTWVVAYSSNGQNWTNAATFSQPLSVTAAGVFGGNVGKNNDAPATTVLVDYFFNTANPINPEDGNTRALQVALVGSGSVTKSPDKATYACGEEVDLTAVPASGWKFEGWTGDLSGTDPQTSLIMDASKLVTATFVPDLKYILTLNKVGNGTVAADPPGPAYSQDTQVQLTATADLGYKFDGWSGSVTSTDNPLAIVMNDSKTITGTFSAAPNRTLNTSVPGGGGTIGVDPAQADYLNGTTVTLTAQATAGMNFVGWGGDLAGQTQNPYPLIMDANKTVTAVFAADVHSLTVVKSPVQGGTVAVDPVKPLYYNGESVQLSVTPANGFVFAGWEGDLTGMTNPATLVMSKNSTVTAKFVPFADLSLTTHIVGPGQIAVDPAPGPYVYGDMVTLTATADSGYAFIGWSGALVGTENPAEFTMTDNAEITATFTQDALYTLDVTPVGSGSVSRSPEKAAYAQDEPVTLTAVPQVGYRFVSWGGALSGETNPATIIMSENKTVTATFLEAEPVSLTVAADPVAAGVVQVSPVKDEYLKGEVVTLTAKSVVGYAFSGWQGDASGNESPLALTLDGDKNVVATFTNQPPQVSDDFSTCELNPMWEWVDPAGAASHVLTGTQLRMVIPAGANYNIGVGGNFGARLMQTARNTNFSAEARFESALTQQYQYQGILIEQDSANYIYFQFYLDEGVTKAYAGTVTNNVLSKRINETIVVQDKMNMLVQRVGDSWKLYYSTDGLTWTKIGASFKHQLEVQKAGVLAGSHSRVMGEQPGHTAVVDYYFNSDAPIVPEDGTSPRINMTIVGSGGVGLSPDKDTYACGEQVTMTATPNTGWVFANWSGDVTGSGTQRQVVVNSVLDITATFVQQGSNAFKLHLPAVLR